VVDDGSRIDPINEKSLSSSCGSWPVRAFYFPSHFTHFPFARVIYLRKVLSCRVGLRVGEAAESSWGCKCHGCPEYYEHGEDGSLDG
jgi:hypothetical protein